MNMKECRHTRREIDESELHQALSDSAVIHLRLCSDCREFREARARLRDLVGSLEPIAAPGDFDIRVRARLAAQRQQKSQGFFAGFAVTVPATIAAALVVMLVGSIVWMAQRNTRQATPTAKVEQPNTTVGANSASTTEKSTAAVALNNDRPDKTDPDQIARNVSVPSGRKPTGLAKTRGRRSMDFNESAARSVRPVDDTGAVSLAAPVRPMVVSMQDDRGMTRTISLPPVSFGSQRLVDNRAPASAAGSRIW